MTACIIGFHENISSSLVNASYFLLADYGLHHSPNLLITTLCCQIHCLPSLRLKIQLVISEYPTISWFEFHTNASFCFKFKQ